MAETAKPDGSALNKEGNGWIERIRASEKRERQWRKDAAAAEKAFTAATSEELLEGKVYDFNILHSNVETIVPAIYNSTPIPDIRRRRVEATGPEPGQDAPPEAHQEWQIKSQMDDDAKAYGDMLEAAISVQIDDSKLDEEIEGSTQDGFMAGRGVVRLRFEADTEGEVPTNERIAFEVVSWRDYREGPAKRWEDVPWIGLYLAISRETFDRMKDDELLLAQETASSQPTDDGRDDDDIVLWEIWDKLSREVLFVRESDGFIVRREPDPLGLPGFFPVPKPVQPISITGKRCPVCPFSIYKKLADEVDMATRRINKIMEGLKVRGIAAGNAQKLVELANAEDNDILIESDLEQLVQTGGLDKAIAWWPVEQAIAVLAQLYQQREQTKQSIYEITGISDIVRGASAPQETATAQQIKTQWGSLRIQKMQRLIERQVRDIFVMMAHLISTKFSNETLVQMTGVEMTAGVQQLMQSPVDAYYRIDVESDSTVRADLTRQKQEMAEFLSGTANFFATMGPVVEQAPEAAGPVSEIYAAAARFFKLGKQAEDAIDELASMARRVAEQPKPNPEQEQAQAEFQMKANEIQARMQIEERKLDMDERRLAMEQEAKTAELAGKAEIEREKLAIERDKATQDMLTKAADHQIRLKESKMRESDDGLDVMTDEEAIMETLDDVQATIMQSNMAILESLQKIADFVTAPKEVELVRDENGRATGAIQRPMRLN